MFRLTAVAEQSLASKSAKYLGNRKKVMEQIEDEDERNQDGKIKGKGFN